MDNDLARMVPRATMAAPRAGQADADAHHRAETESEGAKAKRSKPCRLYIWSHGHVQHTQLRILSGAGCWNKKVVGNVFLDSQG